MASDGPPAGYGTIKLTALAGYGDWAQTVEVGRQAANKVHRSSPIRFIALLRGGV